MSILRYTLISEGTTDAVLIPMIDWVFQKADYPLVEGYRAEFWRLNSPPTLLDEKIVEACKLFPCDILFIHRDADNGPSTQRCHEIAEAISSAGKTGLNLPAVAVVPVRALEAWLLTDQHAIREAAGNPTGSVRLNLPAVSRIEDRPDPKADLRFALRTASELKGRRLKKFDDSKAFWRIVECMDSFESLRALPAFNRFETSIRRMAAQDFRAGFYSELDLIS